MTLRIEGELTIYRAAELAPAMLDAAARGDAFDLSEVSEFDSAGLQLLMLARRQALQTHGAFALAACSGPVREVLQLLALTALFDMEPA